MQNRGSENSNQAIYKEERESAKCKCIEFEALTFSTRQLQAPDSSLAISFTLVMRQSPDPLAELSLGDGAAQANSNSAARHAESRAS